MIKKMVKLAFTVVLATAWAASHAQSNIRPAYQFPPESAQGGPATVQLGDSPAFVMPYLGFGFGYDDNLFLSSVNELSTAFYILSPGLRVDARDANKVLQLSYQAQIGRYADSDDDNYVDHAARAQFDIAMQRNIFFRAGYEWLRAHDPRGATDRPVSTHPDKYELSTPSLTFVVGAPGAAGRVEAYASQAVRRYKNNRDFTAASDRDTPEAGIAFYARIMPRTYVLAEARYTDLDYKQAGSPVAGKERRFYGGIAWEATASTTGTIKAGQLKKDFDNPGLPDFSGSGWEATVTWTPRTYSRFDIYSSRSTNESTGLGAFILTSATGLNWSHGWSSFVSSEVNLRWQRDDYQGADRIDDTRGIGLRLGYKFRRWLTIGAEYSFTNRDSNQRDFQYDKNLYLLTATATM